MIPDRIAILNSDGTTDTSFAVGAGLDNTGYSITALPSGEVVAGGQFSFISGAVRAKLAVLNADGTLAPSIPTPSAAVNTLALQTDGSVIFGGDFTTVSGTTRNRLARLLPDLTLEAAFNPNVNGSVNALALQTDGKILVGGSFTSVGSTTRNRVARLYNGTAANSLYAVSADLIKWDRTGTSEETQRVEFELDTGSGYSALAGVITRTPSGWQIVPTSSLSGSTNTIRATAFPSDSHSEGIQQATVSAPIDPEIQVEIDGAILTSGAGTIYFPSTQVGSSSTKTVTVRNIGLANLSFTGSHVTFSPTGQYSVVIPPADPILPGQFVTFVVTLTPTTSGTKATTMTIYSTDADESNFTVALSGVATPGPGSQDLTWQPVPNDLVLAISQRTNNITGIGGTFTAVGTQTRGRYAFIDSLGNVQTQSGTGVNGDVACIAQLPDGKALIGGSFTPQRIRRLNADGSIDNTFTLTANDFVLCMALLPSGSVLIGGSFTSLTLGTTVTRQHIAKIDFSSTGVASISAFSCTCNENIYSIHPQTDGKIIVSGVFTNIAGSAQRGVARLNSDGSIDTTFAASLTAGGGPSNLDASGRVILGGLNYVSGVDKRGVIRLTTAGVLDTTFTLVASSPYALSPQTDGTLLIGSSTNYPVSTSKVERRTTTGANDTTFSAAATGNVYSLCVQEDGSLLIGGAFTLGGTSTANAAKLINGTASTALSVVSNTAVQWLRGGTLPETQITVFDLSQDGGTTWSRLGQGTRITGGWSLTGISLPTTGILRARAYIQCGYFSGSVSIQEEQLTFSGVLAPDLVVQVPDGTTIPDDGATGYSTAIGGAFIDIPVKLINAGTATLSSIVATLTGWLAEHSITSTPPTSISAGNSDTMVIRFSPASGAKGYRSTTLNIASNNPGTKSTYTIQVNTAAVAVPAATTGAASAIGGGSATLAGTFTPNHTTSTCYFQYKLVASSTWISSGTNTIAGFSPTASTKVVSGLTVGQSYHFRAVVYNSINTITSIPTTGTTSTDPWIGAVVAFTA